MLKKLLLVLFLSFPVLSYALPNCYPAALGGTGQGSITGKVDGVGDYRAWWCESDYTWKLETLVNSNSYLIKHPPGTEKMTMRQTLDAYYKLNVASTCNIPTLCNAAVNAAKLTRPAEPLWKTPASSAADKLLPTYTIVGTTTKTLKAASLRVAPGETCECKRLSLVTSPTTTYCGVRNLPNVAVCKKP